jgi:hypothetical protein
MPDSELTSGRSRARVRPKTTLRFFFELPMALGRQRRPEPKAQIRGSPPAL